jgi:hypothetical protein
VRDVRYVTEAELVGTRGRRLLQYLLDRGADEFTITVMALQDTQAPFADAFEDELAPFERDVAMREVVSDGMELGTVRPVRLWSLDRESLARLLTFFDDGLFHSPAGPDGWLEDLAVYRAGALVFAIASHEREGMLQLTPEEVAQLAEAGIWSTARPS